ncbi:MAG: cellulase-like family protein [Hyphomicrobiales bacterium]
MPFRPRHPLAITMWDFSWIERRWTGAGYEDWDVALDGLAERGYDAVRIDAYPHLVAADPHKTRTVYSCGQHGTWGAPAPVRIRILPELLEFMSKCRDRKIMVGLSSWYKEDAENLRGRIKSPQDQARQWLETLRRIDEAGLIDSICYVDLCNEFPWPKWAVFLYETPDAPEIPLDSPRLGAWMKAAIAPLKAAYPQLDYTFSFYPQTDRWAKADVSCFGVLEPHIWMAAPGTSDYYARIGYSSKTDSFQRIVESGKQEYLERKPHYDERLTSLIDRVADWSRATGLPVITTECWALIHYKDWPQLEWGWIKEICEMGVRHAAATGRWTGIGTSNFCGPQFVGMWRDIDWHLRMTKLIREADVDPALGSTQSSPCS